MVKLISFSILSLVLLFAMMNPRNAVAQVDDRFAAAKARNAIIWLALDKDLSRYQEAIKQDPNAINFRLQATAKADSFDGETALHLAAKNANLPLLKFLLDQKADVQIGDSGRSTPLHFAANKQVALDLIAAGANVHAMGTNGTPLHTAATTGVAEVLLDNGAKIDSRKSRVSLNGKRREGDTPLQAATRHGRIKVMEFLISKGADVNIKSNGYSALYSAAGGSPKTVALLLAHGAAVNGFDTNSSPLWNAVFNHGTESAKLLLDAKAKATEVDQHGWSLLHAAALGCDAKMIELLIAANVDVNLLTNKKESALHIATERANLDAVRVLLAHGVDFRSANADGETPLTLSRQLQEQTTYSIAGTKEQSERSKVWQLEQIRLANERRQQITALLTERLKQSDSEDK